MMYYISNKVLSTGTAGWGSSTPSTLAAKTEHGMTSASLCTTPSMNTSF
jgi:hypothetical protein